MKSNACYPGARTRFNAPVGGFVNPYSPRFTNESTMKYPVANRPAANIIREENGFKIELAVPGLAKDQIKIELQENHLVITGPAASAEAKPKRAFRLHQTADTEAMSATFDQGILTLVIPDKVPVTTKINIV